MNLVRFFARPMLASSFIMDGVKALSDPGATPLAQMDREELAATVPALQGQDPQSLGQAAGAAQVAGGVLLALGKLPRFASAVLAATLVPNAAARYVGGTGGEQDTAALAKDVSLLGGLLIAAMDTAGRPGIAWRAGHAVEHAELAAERKGREAKLAAKLAKARAARRATEATQHTSREAKLAARLAKAEAKRRKAEAKKALTPDVGDLAKGVKKLRED